MARTTSAMSKSWSVRGFHVKIFRRASCALTCVRRFEERLGECQRDFVSLGLQVVHNSFPERNRASVLWVTRMAKRERGAWFSRAPSSALQPSFNLIGSNDARGHCRPAPEVAQAPEAQGGQAGQDEQQRRGLRHSRRLLHTRREGEFRLFGFLDAVGGRERHGLDGLPVA